MIDLIVAHQVVDKPELGPSLHVHVLRDVATTLESAGKLIERCLDVREGDESLVVFLGKVGVLDIDGQIIALVTEFAVLIVIAIQLQQTALCLVYGHTIVGYANLLGKAIRTTIMPIDVEVYGYHVAKRLGINHGRHLLSNGIGGHGAILLVGNEHPLAVFREIEGRLLLLLWELDTVWIFAHIIEAPTGIASSAYLASLHGIYVWPYTGTIQTEGTILYPFLLGIGSIGQSLAYPLALVPCLSIAKGEVNGGESAYTKSTVGKIVDTHLARLAKGNKPLLLHLRRGRRTGCLVLIYPMIIVGKSVDDGRLKAMTAHTALLLFIIHIYGTTFAQSKTGAQSFAYDGHIGTNPDGISIALNGSQDIGIDLVIVRMGEGKGGKCGLWGRILCTDVQNIFFVERKAFFTFQK